MPVPPLYNILQSLAMPCKQTQQQHQYNYYYVSFYQQPLSKSSRSSSAAVVQLLLCLLLLATLEQSLQSQSASHTSRQAVVNKKWQMRSEIFWEISAMKRWHYDLTMSCVNYAENTQCILSKYTENKFIGTPEILVRPCVSVQHWSVANKQDLWSGACMQVTLVNALPILSRSTACIVKLFCCQWLIIPHANAC